MANGINLINLTPHTVNIDDIAIPACGIVARVTETKEQLTDPDTGHWTFIAGAAGFWGFPLEVARATGTDNLPAMQTNTILIVSAQVRLAHPDRCDLASPGELKRDAQGRVIGCSSLIVNECALTDGNLTPEAVKADHFFINGVRTSK